MTASRARIRTLFLRLLGAVFCIAFLSLLDQLPVLIGTHGLLPATTYLAALRTAAGWHEAPTLFWIDASDGTLRAAAVAGVAASCGLIFNIAPRYCLLVCWLLYLSFAAAGQAFLSFQWDNLLLESAFFAFFVTPRGVRPRNAPAPHPFGVFLMLWLVFRLHVESGAAKLLTGDPSWRNLTALVSYYETAPLPTWVGWYAHQMPLWAHRLCAAFTLFVELVVPLFLWSCRRLRTAAFVLLIAMQAGVALTANYGFFNYLTAALCLFVLDDRHLSWIAKRIGWTWKPPVPYTASTGRNRAAVAVMLVLVPISLVPFLTFIRPLRNLNQGLIPWRRVLDEFRSINAYHLFATMTLVRREVVIEGSADGTTWIPYEFRYKPGQPERAPPFVAPHQPRVDFQLWFLLLSGPPRERYFSTLLERLLTSPETVAGLFARDPFPHTPPKFLRLAIYRYRFTDPAERRTTGAWWRRDLLGHSAPLSADAYGGMEHRTQQAR